jgi:trans-aconitate 2-methyltransferase
MSEARREPGRVEWDAGAYHRISSPQYAWGQRVLARLALEGSEVVADAGCGSGRLTAELLERLPRGRVVAVDQSQNMLDEARATLSRFGDRVTYVSADLQTLELSAPVDVIFSTATLHWILDHPRLFRHLFGALKPGGRLVAQCGGGRNIQRLHDRAADLMATEPYAAAFASWSEPWEFADDVTTAARLREAGFVEVKAWLEPALTPFPDAATFGDFITKVVLRNHLGYLASEADRARFIAALVDTASRDEPPFSLDYVRLNIQAQRP